MCLRLRVIWRRQCSPTPTPIPIYSTIVCPPTPTPILIYSIVLTSAQVPSIPTPTITNCTGVFPNPAIISSASRQGPHPSLTAQQEALVQPTMSAQAPISSPILALTPHFNVQLDPADMDFLKKKSEPCKTRQKNALLSEGQIDPYGKIFAALEQALREGSGSALPNLLRTQLQTDRETGMTAGARKQEVVLAKRLVSMLSLTPSAGMLQ